MSDLPILAFASPKDFERWLAKHHASSDGIWLQLTKKAADPEAMTYAQALDEALCYGWIDGQKQSHDERSWLQRFTPRRARSPWSKINVGHAERLIKAKKMRTAGLARITEAKNDGRWERAYDGGKLMTVPGDFLKELAKNKKAFTFFGALNKANIYAIAYRLQTAKKPETRAARMQKILEMMKKGEKFH